MRLNNLEWGIIMNHVSYHKRKQNFITLRDLIEVGDFQDYGSPYFVFNPSGRGYTLLHTFIYDSEGSKVNAKDFYERYGYKGAVSLTYIMSQLIIGRDYSKIPLYNTNSLKYLLTQKIKGRRMSKYFPKGKLSDSHSFKFKLKDSRYEILAELCIDGEFFGHIKLVPVGTSATRPLYKEDETKESALTIEAILGNWSETKEELTKLCNLLYNTSKGKTITMHYRSEDVTPYTW